MPKLLKRRATRRHDRLAVQRMIVETAPPDQATELGAVRCFVDPEELRRLLSLMAGVELVGLLLAR
jgi:hypothetical protein